jgi:hypothetical protein
MTRATPARVAATKGQRLDDRSKSAGGKGRDGRAVSHAHERPAGPRAWAASVPPSAAGDRPQATLRVDRLDPWSVMRFSLATSLVVVVIVMVAVVGAYLLYRGLDAIGVVGGPDDTTAGFAGGPGSSAEGFEITAGGVVGAALVLGGTGAVVFVGLMTLGALIHNVCARVVGGVRITLADGRSRLDKASRPASAGRAEDRDALAILD